MKSIRMIAIGVLSALSLGVAVSAQAQTAGAEPGMMGPRMQGQRAGQHGGMAEHQGHRGAQHAARAPQQHGDAGAGAMGGGCPMMSMMSEHGTPAATQK